MRLGDSRPDRDRAAERTNTTGAGPRDAMLNGWALGGVASEGHGGPEPCLRFGAPFGAVFGYCFGQVLAAGLAAGALTQQFAGCTQIGEQLLRLRPHLGEHEGVFREWRSPYQEVDGV